jgi:hypothetical protein
LLWKLENAETKNQCHNADQAMVADNIMTSKTNDVTSAAKLVAATVDQPMPNIGPSQKELVPVEGGRKYE